MLTALTLADQRSEVSGSTWASDLARWTAYMETIGLSAVTVRQYRRTVVVFIADTLLELDAVTEDDVVDYLAAKPAKGHSRGAVLRALRAYYAYAAPRKGRPNPCVRLKPKRAKYGPAP